MRQLLLAAACAASFSTMSAGAQSPDWHAGLDPDVLGSGEIYLELQYDGQADGFMRFGWQADGDEIAIYDRTMWASRETYETMEARISLSDLAPRFVDIRFHQGSSYYHIDIGFEPGQAAGEMVLTRPGQPDAIREVDTQLEPGTILRASVFIVAAALPLGVGDSVSFDWYAPLGNSVAEVTLRAVEEIEIDTPAGHYRTLRLEQRGGTPDNDIFVDRETGRIVRIDIGGQPMRFVAPAPAE